MSENVARMGEMGNEFSISVGKPEKRDHWKHLCVDRRIILEWILGKYG